VPEQPAGPDVSRSDYWRHLGMRMTRQEPGEADVVLDIGPPHMQALGVVHGGVIASLADAAMAVAFSLLVPGEGMSTVDLSIRFMRPAVAGRLVATGRVVHTTRTLYFAEATVRCGDQAVAMAQATFRRMAGRSPSGEAR
jgi:uncharacterized protein (TIGR00369 family)